MTSRRTSDTSGGVLSFTYLDVLTCTMGTLMLLLVVLGDRAKNAPADGIPGGLAGPSPPLATIVDNSQPAPTVDGSASSSTAEEAVKQLAELRKRQADLDRLRAEAADRLRDEQLRVSHLEDHERRLEHELAKLHIAMEQLQATEEKQQVDQSTAERELERLKSLVEDTEAQLAEAQQESRQHSYAIVPYKGANGTNRRPIYIECTREAVIIQPEGIRLTPADFDGPVRSGNPLAAAVRAAREDLNTRAGAAGVEELPDPYPLLIVRPDGATAYLAALSAIRAWDADFGYEFVEADWKLEYPAIDPRLEQVMVHAVDQARARQALLAKAAPRRYGGRLSSATAGPGGNGMGRGEGDEGSPGSGGGFDVLAESEGAGDKIGQHSGDGQIGARGSSGGGMGGQSQSGPAAMQARGDNGYRTASSVTNANVGGGDFADQFTGAGQGGADGGSEAPVDGGTSSVPQAGGAGSTASAASNGAAGSPNSGAPTSERNSLATAGANGSSMGSPNAGPAPDVHAAATMAPTDNPYGSAGSNAGAGTPTDQSDSRESGSMAKSRGANWANAAASRRASAITRPIQVAVRPGELVVLRDGGGAPAEVATVVSFQQPTEQVMDQLATSLQQQIKEWGLAGRSMYWRPTLMLQVAPGAERQAARLAELLEDSGVDVRLPQTAARPTEDARRAR